MPDTPSIIYVPGLKPKPEAAAHREQLLRCLLAGIRRVDPGTADAVAATDAFRLIDWTYDFYGEYRDIRLDLDDIERLLAKEGPDEADIVTVTSLRRRFAVWLFRAADLIPALIPRVATDEVQIHLRDFNRYVRNENDIAGAARRKLKAALTDAREAGRPVLLLAHSMGSVIAWDALWEMSRREDSPARVDLLVTTGSPLGQRIVQRQLFGHDRTGASRYPDNIGRWINIAAVGELTAIDRTLRDDFGRMIELGLVPDIDDREVFNYYHMDGVLNVHIEYGYMINETFARIVSEWWRGVETRPDPGSA